MEKRKAFNFYRSYYDVAKELPENERSEFTWAIINAQFTGKIIEPKSKLAKLVFAGIRHSIEKQLEGYKHGLKGPKKGPSKGRVKGPNQEPLPQVQVQEKEQEKEKVKSIKDRKQEFASLLSPFVEKYGRDFINDFYGYWTEHGANDRKMRFEKQTSFSVKRRLKTWESNGHKFGTIAVEKPNVAPVKHWNEE